MGAMVAGMGLLSTGSWRGLGAGLWVSAGDPVDLTGDITGIVRGQQHIGRGEFRGLARAPERRVTTEVDELFGRLAPAGLERSPDRAGRGAVDADAFGDQLLGEALHEDRHGAL